MSFVLEIGRSRVRVSSTALLSTQAARTRVPQSPSSIIWYWLKGGDALRPGR